MRAKVRLFVGFAAVILAIPALWFGHHAMAQTSRIKVPQFEPQASRMDSN